MVVTNHQAHGEHGAEATDWRGLIRDDSTLVIYMPGHDFAALRAQLLAAGCAPDMPAAIVSRATTPESAIEFTTVADAPRKLPPTDSPAILLVGRSLDSARLRAEISSAAPAFSEAELQFSSLNALTSLLPYPQIRRRPPSSC